MQPSTMAGDDVVWWWPENRLARVSDDRLIVCLGVGIGIAEVLSCYIK